MKTAYETCGSRVNVEGEFDDSITAVIVSTATVCNCRDADQGFPFFHHHLHVLFLPTFSSWQVQGVYELSVQVSYLFIYSTKNLI